MDKATDARGRAADSSSLWWCEERSLPSSLCISLSVLRGLGPPEFDQMTPSPDSAFIPFTLYLGPQHESIPSNGKSEEEL